MNNSRTKNKLEQEFNDFLVQKINRAGGSLPFQFLFGCLPQELRFEIKDAFAKTKSDVMKFLRGHPKTFKVDTKGIVTLITSSAVEEDSDSSIENYENENKSKRNMPPKIENGEGTIEKLSAKFAVIRALKPFPTYIHFTPHEYGAKSGCLFVDLDLELGSTVGFDAVSGMNNYEIEYRATKVWRNFSKNESAPSKSDVGKKFNSIEAGVSRNDPGYESQPKKERQIDDSSSKSEKNRKDSVENEPGKIYPYRNGAVIKFGEGYSERADGKTSKFYLYGSEIRGLIDLEFSEGDDILFDGVKTENGWKALLVWHGEKPNSKEYLSEKRNKIHNFQRNKSPSISKPSQSSRVSSENHNLPVKPKEKKFIPASPKKENVTRQKYIPLDHSNITEKSSDKYRHESSRNNYEKNLSKKTKKHSKKDNFRGANNSRDGVQKSNLNFNNYNDRYTHSSRESISDRTFESNQDTSDDDSEIQNISHSKKFLKQYSSPIGSDNEFADSNEEDCEVISNSSKGIRNSSIRKFYDVEGKIVQLFCKYAMVYSPQVSEQLDFVLSTLFLNGKSVEEQNVIDLKEVVKVGDDVKFNYFEIIDDSGFMHRKITLAWIGLKPDVQEMTPEEFIKEFELSVSGNCEFDDKCIEENESTQNILSITNSKRSDNVPEFFSPRHSPVLDEMVEELKELSDDPVEYSSDSRTENNENDFDTPPSEICPSSLSDEIMERLRTKGCISSRSEVDIRIVVEDIINTVMSESNIKRSKNVVANLQCLTCAERIRSKTVTSNVEVQTIITGEIVATSIYTQN